MIRWINIIYISVVASSLCFGDIVFVREALITPKSVNAAVSIDSVNSSVNVRMDLAKIDIHIATPGDGAFDPLPVTVIATFELVNESSDELKLTVGFPISNSEYSSFELSHFHVVTDGTVREVFRRTSGYSNLMVWEETFSPAQRKTIVVDYEIEIPLQENKVVRKRVESRKERLSLEVNGVPVQFLQKVDSGSYYFFDYYLASGASWAGSIGFEEITLHFDHWWRDLEFYSTIEQNKLSWSNLTPHSSIPIVVTYQLRDEEPTENIYFAIRPGKNNHPEFSPLENKKTLLAESRAQWKKGELEKALLTLEEAVKSDPSNKQIAKVLKSMQLQKKKIDGLLSIASDFIDKSDYQDAKKSLKRASYISESYPEYKKVLQQLVDAKQKAEEKNESADFGVF